jgi:sugar-specific transcriptional regulator TrmB
MLLIEDEDLKTLNCLGLTGRQARVYLALLRLGLSKAEAISKASIIHRQEIYRVVAGLQEMGLVEIKVNTPTLFSAIPIEEALIILVQRKTKELSEIRGKTKILAEKFCRIDLQATPPVEESYFSIISESDRGRKFRHALENVHETMDIVTIWKTFRQGFTLFDDSLKKALQKGVTLRVITEKPESETFPKWVIPALTKKSIFKIKAISNTPPAIVTIFDNTEVSIAINVTADFTGGPHLWSNCRNLVALSRAYFDCLWMQLEDPA